MPCFEGTIIFCSRLKIHKKISLKKVALKNSCLKRNVRNTVSSKHLLIRYKGNTKVTLKILDIFEHPC